MNTPSNTALLSDLAFEGRKVRTVTEDETLWWALPDVAKVLDLTRQAARMFLKSPKCSAKGVKAFDTLTGGGHQQVTFVNERNLYALVGQSNKPDAIRFMDWVYDDVLPTIRKKGFYVAPGADDYHRMLAMFVPGGVRPWEAAFPEEFFREVCRLNGWKFNPKTHHTPSALAGMIRDVLYERLPDGVMARLDELNPANPATGRRPKRFHQFLAEEAVAILKERIRALVASARNYNHWHDFKAWVDATYPKPGKQMVLPGSLPTIAIPARAA